MKTARIVAAALPAVWGLGGGQAAAEVSCSAAAVPLVFPSVRSDDIPRQAAGWGALDVTCGGGQAAETVHLCLRIGAGGGGGSGDDRYLDGSPPPVYRLAYGATALTIDATIPLGSFALQEDGNGTTNFTLDGMIDWAGRTGGHATGTSAFAGSAVQIGYAASQQACAPSTDVTGFSVSAAYEPACTVVAGDLDFGSLGAYATAATDASTSITVNCPEETSYVVTLGDGLWKSSGSGGLRAMRNRQSFLSYGLYEDAPGGTAWGAVEGTGTGDDQPIPVYGRIPAGQGPLGAGTYTDVVVVTVTYQ